MAARDACRSFGQWGGLGAIRWGAAVACQRGGISRGVAGVVVVVPLVVPEPRLGCDGGPTRPALMVHDDERLVHSDHIAAERASQSWIHRCFLVCPVVVEWVCSETRYTSTRPSRLPALAPTVIPCMCAGENYAPACSWRPLARNPQHRQMSKVEPTPTLALHERRARHARGGVPKPQHRALRCAELP